MRPLRIAKENLSEAELGLIKLPTEDSIAQDITQDSVVELGVNVVNELDSDVEEANYALEELSIIRGALEHLIESNQCTNGTLLMVNTAMHNAMCPQSYGKTLLAMEAQGDIVQQHKVALEGIGDFFNDIFQNIVVGNKKSMDAQRDVFKNIREAATKYHARGAAAVAEFQRKKGSFNSNEHRGFLGSVWEFFTDENGEVADVGERVKKDLEVSRYVLDTYPKKVLDAANRLSQVIRSGNVATAEDIKKMAQAVSGLTHPADLFDKKLLNGHPHLGVTGYKVKTGRTFGEIEILGVRLPKLTQLTEARRVELDYSMLHQLRPLWKSPSAGKNFKYVTSEIGIVCQASVEYANLARGYCDLERSFEVTHSSLDDSFKQLTTKAASVTDKDAASALTELLEVLRRLQFDFLKCFRNPGNDEARRAVRGAQFCNYLGLRMIYNAK